MPLSRIEVGHPWELLAGEPLPTPPSNVSAFSWFDGLVLVLETSATAAIGVAIEKSTLALHRRVGRRLRGTARPGS